MQCDYVAMQGFRMGKDSQVVTAIGIDNNGNVWTGHQKVSGSMHMACGLDIRSTV